MRRTRKLRNIGIIAHVDAGKTTLSERILLYTGRIHRTGEVHDGNTRLDHSALEKKHGITITAAAVSCAWREHTINLIDTPGHVDFTIEVERSLRVLDGAVCVFDGVAGVEAQTETVWRQADRHAVPRICFVNKLDRVGADFDRVVADIEARLSGRPVVVTSPIGAEAGFAGVVDVVRMRALTWAADSDGRVYDVAEIPADLRATALGHREALVEACADVDERVLAEVLEGREPSAEQLVRALRMGTCRGVVVPVLAGSAYKNCGVQPLLDAVVDYLPDPLDGAVLRDRNGGAPRRRGPAEPLAALCFKVVFDRHGQTSFVRVYSGALTKGTTVFCSRRGQTLRVSRLVRMFADAREEVDTLACGDIGAIIGARLVSGETLCDPASIIALEPIAQPEPLVHVVVEARSSADERRLDEVLSKVVAADSSLRLATDPDTGQRRLSGMGQLHLDITMEKLREEHNLEASIGPPRVAYRQTATAPVETSYTFSKQTGGPGMFARVALRIDPAGRGEGVRFLDETRGGVVPEQFARSVEAGVTDACAEGVAGIPIVDVVVTLTDGATHVKDSSELSFRIAGRLATLEAMREARRVVLEPYVVLEAGVPVASAGVVIGDVARRRGEVMNLHTGNGEHVIRASLPLGETFGYAGALSAMTGGRGRFTLEPAGYEPVPATIAARIAAA